MNDKPKDKLWYELIRIRLESMPKEFKPEVNNVNVAGEEIWLDIDKI